MIATTRPAATYSPANDPYLIADRRNMLAIRARYRARLASARRVAELDADLPGTVVRPARPAPCPPPSPPAGRPRDDDTPATLFDDEDEERELLARIHAARVRREREERRAAEERRSGDPARGGDAETGSWAPAGLLEKIFGIPD